MTNQILALKTAKVTDVFSKAFEFFNREMFNGELPATTITLVRLNALGYFLSNSFCLRVNEEQIVNEIGMNPSGFVGKSDIDILSTLVHEMCHLWDYVTNGNPKSPGYHQKSWAMKMLEVGLKPVSLDQPGKMYGYKVTHEIMHDGAFLKFARKFLQSKHNKIIVQDWYALQAKKNNGKKADTDEIEIEKDKPVKTGPKSNRRKAVCSCGLTFSIPRNIDVTIKCNVCDKEMQLTD